MKTTLFLTINHIDGKFNLDINGKKIFNPETLAAVVSKAYSELVDHTVNNPEDKQYRIKVNAFVNAIIDGGIKKLSGTTKHGLNVAWQVIIDTFSRGKNIIS